MQSFLVHAGYLALILFGFVEACSIPISSEITFGFAGVLAYQGHLNLALVIIIGSAAELAGSFTSYAVGRKGGRPAVERFGRYVLITQRDLDRAERFFAGRGAWAVTVARLLPVLRAFVGIVAGLVEVPFASFALFNLIGTVVWAAALSGIGYAVGSTWDSVSRYLSIGGYVIVLLVVAAMAAVVAIRLREVRRERATAAGRDPLADPRDAARPGAPGHHDTPGRHDTGRHDTGRHDTPGRDDTAGGLDDAARLDNQSRLDAPARRGSHRRDSRRR